MRNGAPATALVQPQEALGLDQVRIRSGSRHDLMPEHTSVEGLVLKPTRRDDPVGLVVMAGNPGNARHKVSQEGVPPARLLGDYKPRSVD